jgi:hypothetical protein
MSTMDDMYDMYKLLEYLDRPVTRRLHNKEFDVGRERMPDGAGLVLRMTATNAAAADKEKGADMEISKADDDLDLGHDRSSSQAISSSASVMLPSSPAAELSDSARMAQYSPNDPDNPYNWSNVSLHPIRPWHALTPPSAGRPSSSSPSSPSSSTAPWAAASPPT